MLIEEKENSDPGSAGAVGFLYRNRSLSELVQLKLNIETSVGESTPTEAEYGGALPLAEVGVSRLDDCKAEA